MPLIAIATYIKGRDSDTDTSLIPRGYRPYMLYIYIITMYVMNGDIQSTCIHVVTIVVIVS